MEDNQGTPQTVAPEGEEPATDKLSDCPDHRPTSFLKGKPRSIISLLCFIKYHLSPLYLMHYVIRVDWKHLMHRTTLSSYIYLKPCVGLGLNIYLAMLRPVEVR